jgi:hypothetical protein
MFKDSGDKWHTAFAGGINVSDKDVNKSDGKFSKKLFELCSKAFLCKACYFPAST